MSADEDEMKEMVGGCCVCSDERGWDENPLVYCDGAGCNVAVHQACYGIVTVPSGPWFCRKCESPERSTRGVRCELCPSKDGALKRTDQNGWAHVVCALYIPEVRFGNVTTMEPILISLIPPERFHKTCYICEDNNRGSNKATIGACMQCNKQGCKQNFHVTCAQLQGLLCEEAGNMDNVKYCGYCQHHYGKLMKNYNSMLNSSQNKSSRSVKIIPPFRPVPANSANVESPGSSPEKSKTGSSSGLNDDKNPPAVLSSQRNSASSTPSNNPGDSTASGKNSSIISPDISSCSKGSKNSKKITGNNGGNSKSGLDSSNGGKPTSIKINLPILTPATFTSLGSSKSSVVVEEKSLDSKGKTTPQQGKAGDDQSASPVKCDDNLMIKLERVDEKNSPNKGAIQGRKDLTTLELKEVVAAALDRPMTSTGNKFDHVSSALTGGIEPPMSSIGSTGSASSHSSRHSHGEKPAPPDIKPHVTLTPIPMRGSTTRMSLSRAEEAREEREKEAAKSKDKSPPVGALSFHNSFGPPKLHSQNQQSSPDTADSTSKTTKPPDLSQQSEPVIDKAGPPTKRARGASREEDRLLERKAPAKGRGGRRGAGNPNFTRREVSNGSFADDNSHDDPVIPMEVTTSSSTRGGRSGPGRKPGSSRLSGRPPADDPPAPTLSQLKSQMEASGDTSLSALPPHMFGNALNPASSMAQRMVDTLSQEMEAVVAAGGVPDITGTGPSTPIVGISMPGKLNPPPVNGASTSSVSHAPASAPPQTLEQLLERQWEQGSQFLMEQAQHLDISQLLSCLNQLKQDNRALEEHVQSLVQRKDQLIAINARLSIPLGNNTTIAPLGAGFNSATNGNNHNGHGTPPPTLQPQTMMSSSGPKGLQISSSTLSPQQQHEMMMHHGRHGSRDDRIHSHSSEMQVSRSEIGAGHSQNQHSHSHHSVHQRGQSGSSYGPYSGHPVPVVTTHPSSHHHGPHHSSRDAPR